MSHSNSSQAHDFYYSGVDYGEQGDYAGCTISYRGCTAFSYRTVVAMVIPRKGVKPEEVRTSSYRSGMTLVSISGMTPTTAGHLSKLKGASPFDLVPVPFEYGCDHVTPEGMAKLFIESLEAHSKLLNRSGDRNTFMTLVQSVKTIRDEACEMWAKPFRDRKFRKYLAFDVEKIKAEIQARNRKAAARAASETKAVLAKYVKDRCGKDYCEFVCAVMTGFCPSGKYRFKHEECEILRKKLFGCGNSWEAPAYVWLDGDFVETSKGIRVPVSDAKVAMRLWALGKDMRTVPVGKYTIVSYQGDSIKIGCHNIPRENMLALYEAVMGKPFPERQPADAKEAT